jgi:hypothetical protein
MSTLNNKALTLSDHAKRIDPDGKTPKIVELLAQTNEVLDDMKFMEGNLPTGHRITVRVGLPQVFWRLLNAGVQPSKSQTAQIDEQCGMMEAWSEVDQEVAELNGNVNSFRLSEAQAFLEAMNQEMSSTLFYGNSSLSPEEFNGFSIRYSSLSGSANSQNVISGGGAGSDNTSIYLVVWGENTCCGIFPKGSKAGLSHEDLGLQTIETTNGIAGDRMRAYQDHFKWKTGLALKDWRYVVRICNIDVSDLDTGSPADLINLMIKAIHRIPNINMGKACFYANRSILQYLDIQRRDDMVGSALAYQDIDGKKVPHFRSIPLKVCDSLLETEATVA